MKWKKIEGYENYSVSDTGLVRNNATEKLISPYATKKGGYLRLGLGNNGIRKNFLVHRLVAQAFIPNPDNFDTVDHINGDRTDNRVENLQWLSNRDNIKRFWNGISDERRKSISNFLKGNADRYRKATSKPVVCLETDKVYESSGQAARELNLCRSHILRVAKGEYKQAKGYHFKFLGE